jgi:hypothetical protein
MRLEDTMSKVGLAAIVALGFVFTVSAEPPQRGSGANKGLVARGRYLVINVGQCGDCHTPMKMGKPVQSQFLHGAVIPFKPTGPVPGWTAVSPRIAGLPGWTEEQGITFFTTGKKPNGTEASPPMPAYRYNRADAIAIVAYLKSLGGK